MNNYKLIDTGDGRRLEDFGGYILDRPDPEILWKKSLSENKWRDVNAFFAKDWKKRNIPEKWQMEHSGIKFWAKLAPFKHTGIFPEQSGQWDYIFSTLQTRTQISVLNLFGYTGIASLFASKAGAKVTHVDASKPSITWANENALLNNITNIRWIVDDALKFTEREVKRGIKYDAILMDPPVYGHGPKGEIWDFNRDFPKLLENCKQILSNKPSFVLVNAYAISLSSVTLANTLEDYFKDFGGKVDHGELTLKEESRGRTLSTGIWGRWSN